MAGMWDLVYQNFDPSFKRINIKLFRCELVGVALGVRARANAKTNIETELGRTLSTEEIADLTAIADNFETGTVEDRLVYNSKVEMACNAAELGIITESQWRALMEIS